MSERPSKAKPAIVTFGSNVFVALVLTIVGPDDTSMFKTWRSHHERWVEEEIPDSDAIVNPLPDVGEDIIAACHEDRSINALLAALGDDVLQPALLAARKLMIGKYSRRLRYSTPQWTHRMILVPQRNDRPLQIGRTVWPIMRKMRLPETQIVTIHQVLLQPPTQQSYDRLTRIFVFTDQAVEEIEQVKKAMNKFFEFREMAFYFFVKSQMSNRAHPKHHVSSIGIDNLRLVWRLLGGGC